MIVAFCVQIGIFASFMGIEFGISHVVVLGIIISVIIVAFIFSLTQKYRKQAYLIAIYIGGIVAMIIVAVSGFIPLARALVVVVSLPLLIIVGRKIAGHSLEEKSSEK